MSDARFRWSARSDTGRVREINQDAVYADDGVFVVADGMGGHRGGEVASAVAVATIEAQGRPRDLADVLDTIDAANAAILTEASNRPELSGMGTTVCALVHLPEPEPRLVVLNVGDSRVYRVRGSVVDQVTEDHSLVQTLVREGQLAPEDAAVHPQRNILTRALGVSHDLEIDHWELPVRAGERFVLCSDGLFNEVSDGEIADICRAADDLEAAVTALVDLANERGSRDNVTALVVEVVDGDDGEPAALPVPPQVTRVGSSAEHPAPAAAQQVTWSDDVDHAGARWRDDDREVSDHDHPARRFYRGFRLFVFVAVVLAVLGAATALVGYYARASYYVDVVDDRIAVYQGRPGGVLWFDPTLETTTDVAIDDLTPSLRDEVQGNPSFGSLDEALTYADGLRRRATEVAGTTGTPSPTPTPA